MPEKLDTLSTISTISEADIQAADKNLAALTAPIAMHYSTAGFLALLLQAVFMTSLGAGLKLLADPGVTRAIGGACAGVLISMAWRKWYQVCARQLTEMAHAAGGAEPGTEPWWLDSARTHYQSLPGRIPAATLDAIGRYLPELAGDRKSAHVYVPPCTGKHTQLCLGIGLPELPDLTPDHRLLIVGQHPAANSAVVAGSLAHELRHVRGWTNTAFEVIRLIRRPVAWTVVGAAGSLGGWLWVLVAAIAFQAATVGVLWAVEHTCDHQAAKAEGRDAILAALRFFGSQDAALRHDAPVRWLNRRMLIWLTVPAHPPLFLRRAVIRLGSRWSAS